MKPEWLHHRLVFMIVVSQAIGTTATTTTLPVCTPGYYGNQCTERCGNCQETNKRCDPSTGHCSACAPGYNFTADPTCFTKCTPGWYGSSCRSQCSTNCKSPESCNHVNGTCPCQPGWKGSQCSQKCEDHKYGDQCSQTCGRCSQNAVCDKVTGYCPGQCDPGYDPTDRLCLRDCSSITWGQNCSHTCGDHCVSQSGRRCNKVNGSCSCQPGYKTPFCQDECSNGQWGQNCGNFCSEHCVNVCNKITGWCTCETGYKPSLCAHECNGGDYGQNCASRCGSCQSGSTTCNHVTGNCSRCQDNWEMPLCQGCIPGQWGPTCGQRCGQCGGNGRCDQDSGTCLDSQCLDGWISSACDVKCSLGYYGQNCAQKCGRCRNQSPCRHDNGICEQDCEDGYTGVLCRTEKESLTGPIVGSVLGAGVLIAVVIVVLAVCYVKRFAPNRPKTPKKDFMGLDQTDSHHTTNQHESLSARDSQVYQNMSATSGQEGINNSGYDHTSFIRQDSHAYAVHSPGKDPVQHTYQNTGKPNSGADPQKQKKEAELAAPDATYGNMLPPSPPEATYGNVSGGRAVYGNFK